MFFPRNTSDINEPLMALMRYTNINFALPIKFSTWDAIIIKEYILTIKWMIPTCKNALVSNLKISPLFTRVMLFAPNNASVFGSISNIFPP